MYTKEQIIALLKNEIITMELTPGMIVSETALTERFGLSRTPLRDVLKQLALESYIDIYPKKGNIVSYIDLESVEQIIYLRSLLEKEIIKELTSRLSITDIHVLKTILEQQYQVIQNDESTDTFLNLDDTFHHTLFKLAGREFLWDIIQQRNVHYVRYRRLHMLKKEKLKDILKEHQLILEYMVQEQTEKVDQLIQQHLKDDINSLDFKSEFSTFIQNPL
ncbi:putative HTH-type transcriptional regulator YdfH [compost metagenome]